MSVFEVFKQNPSTTSNGYESTALDSLLFPVSSVPLYWNNNGINTVVPEEYKEAGYTGVLDVNRNVILYAGKDYSIIRNSEIIEALEPAFAQGYRLVRVRNFNNTKFQIDLENKDVTGAITVGDRTFDVTGRIRICNSYDGSLAFGMQMGFWIQVCSNGAIAGDMLAYKKKHSTGNGCVEHIESGIRLLTNDALSKSTSKLNKMWTITDPAQIQGMFKQLVDGIPDPKDGMHPVKVSLLNRITIENNTYQNDVFAMYMAVTNMTTFPSQYGLAPSYLQRLETNTAKVFK